MKNKEFIFDIDGTLYPIDGVPGKKFSESKLYARIKMNVLRVLSDLYKTSPEETEILYKSLKEKYNGSISRGVEEEKGLEQVDYFRVTWDANASDYLPVNKKIRETLMELGHGFVALTTAPKVWASQVLDFLNVTDLFSKLITAENKLSKPDPGVFLSIVQDRGSKVGDWVSVGDQLHSDILPAKRLGMRTVLVGSNDPVADFSINTIQELPMLVRSSGWNL